MALSKSERQKIADVLEHVDPHIGPGEAIALAVKFMALQTRLLNDLLNELGNIAAAIERHPRL